MLKCLIALRAKTRSVLARRHNTARARRATARGGFAREKKNRRDRTKRQDRKKGRTLGKRKKKKDKVKN
jgi:hypothetical protein